VFARVLKGHGFSRAERALHLCHPEWALAREGSVRHSITMVEELEQEFSALRDKVHDLQEYL
jgi:hypothetical protein